MSGSFTTNITKNTETYTGVTGTITAPVGVNAQFDINRSGVNYSVTSVSQAGSGYKQGDVILITGNNLGGLTPANDATIVVTTVNGSGGVTGQVLQVSIKRKRLIKMLLQHTIWIGNFRRQSDISQSQIMLVLSVSIHYSKWTTGYVVNDVLTRRIRIRWFWTRWKPKR